MSIPLYQEIANAVEYTDTLLLVSTLRLEKAELTAVFVLFGDESGNHTNEEFPFMALAGYFAPTFTWKLFKAEWAKALEDFGLPAFHMYDYLRRKEKPYCDWSDARYEKCIERFIETINAFNPYGFAVQVPRDAFNATISRSVKKRIVHDPYILLFDTAITMVLTRMYFQPRDEQLTMYFHQTSFESKARKVYERRRRNDPNNFRLSKDLFFVSDDFLPIQAADLLASLARNYARGRASGGLPITPKIEELLKRLNRPKMIQWRLITKEKLQETNKSLAARFDGKKDG
jgi:hypothetical protein